jgi:hypothetical protein
MIIRRFVSIPAETGYVLRLLARVEAHPRKTLQAALQVHSAATPFLGRGGKHQPGEGIRRFDPGHFGEAGRPGPDEHTNRF